MAEVNRRKFLLASAGVGAVGLLSGGAAVGWWQLERAARDNPLAAGSGILVIVTLYGGNDGLSTVIPYTNNAYFDARRDLSYGPEEVIHLDDRLGFNPAWKGLAGVWNDKHLAIVRGVSYPNPDRSHFRSMDIWQSASPDDAVRTGWIGRWLDATGDDPLRAVNIGAVLPPMAVGEKNTAAALSGGWSSTSDVVANTITALSAENPDDTAAMSAVCRSYRSTQSVDTAFMPIVTADGPAMEFVPTAGSFDRVEDDKNPLADELNMVAKCVKAGVPTRVYMVKLGGFDTHADERDTQEKLLAVVDAALTPFLRDMATDKHGKNVVVMVYSEFGRRVRANASHGTDHGAAGPVFIAGPSVKGGFYGDDPSLTDLDEGDLKCTTDFRDIYHELLSKTLGSDPTPSVGTGRRDLGFLSSEMSA
jgi:uncharacterized protein (DUF1501 family)